MAVPLLVYRLTRSATDLGATTAVTYLPWIFFGLPGGTLLDRVDRKRVMIVSDLVRATTICLIPALAGFGALNLTWIYAVVFVQSSMQVLFASGRFTAVAALVTKDRLVRANAVLTGSFSGATVLGSALAAIPVGSLCSGWIIGTTGDVRAVFVTVGVAIVVTGLAFRPSLRATTEETCVKELRMP